MLENLEVDAGLNPIARQRAPLGPAQLPPPWAPLISEQYRLLTSESSPPRDPGVFYLDTLFSVVRLRFFCQDPAFLPA